MTRALVAGVGNVFLGDDGFGVEVALRLLAAPLPDGVTVLDIGIRGLHLAYHLLDPVDLLIVADAVSRGGAPGTLYVIDPDLERIEGGADDAHGMDLPSVFASVQALGGTLPRIRIVGCEPAALDEGMGLSAPVAHAVDAAVTIVRRLLVTPTASAAHDVKDPEERCEINDGTTAPSRSPH